MQPAQTWDGVSLPHFITALKSRMRQVAWRRLAPFGVSPQQYQMLMALAEGGEACHGELATRTWMDKPTATRTLGKLIERGLITAEREPGPRHRTRYRLEPSGRELVAELQDFRAFMRSGMEAGLDAPTRLALRRTLASVMDNLDRMEAALQASAPEA